MTTPHAACYTTLTITTRVCTLSNEVRITKCLTLVFCIYLLTDCCFFFKKEHSTSGLSSVVWGAPACVKHHGSMFSRQASSCSQRYRRPDPAFWEGEWLRDRSLGLEVSVEKPRPSHTNWVRIRIGGGEPECLGLLEGLWKNKTDSKPQSLVVKGWWYIWYQVRIGLEITSRAIYWTLFGFTLISVI